MFTKQNIIHMTIDVLLITVLFLYMNNKNKAVNDSVEQLREYTEEQIDNVNNKIDKLIKYVTKTQSAREPPQQRYQHVQPQRTQYYEEQEYVQQPTRQSPTPPQGKKPNISTPKKQVKFRDTETLPSTPTFKPAQPSQPSQSFQTSQLNPINDDLDLEESVEDISESPQPPKEMKEEVDDFISSLNPNFNISMMSKMPQMNPMHFNMRPNVTAFVATSSFMSNRPTTQQQSQAKIEVIDEEIERQEQNEEKVDEERVVEEKLDDLDILEIEKAIGL